jgi:uncharacterized protein
MARQPVIILAIDGGGIRGIIPAYILQQIETTLGKPCYQLFDMIGGTSTGGIIAAALTTPNPANPTTSETIPFAAAEVLKMYRHHGGQIFYKQESLIEQCAPYYADDGQGNGIEPYLQHAVGAAMSLSSAHDTVSRLTGARIKHMFTTCYEVCHSGYSVTPPAQPVLNRDFGPYLFNWANAVQDPIDDYYVWEAARGTSAAPDYFPIALVGGANGITSPAFRRWVVDGGVMSNNPAVWGLSEAFRLRLAASLNDITIVSLGTGIYTGAAGVGIHNNDGDFGVYPDNGNWNLVPWMGPSMYDLAGYQNDGTLVNIILDSVQLVANKQLKGMRNAGLKYYRLEPQIPESLSAMDDVTQTNIDALLACAQTYLATGAARKRFDEIVEVLRDGSVS